MKSALALSIAVTVMFVLPLLALAQSSSPSSMPASASSTSEPAMPGTAPAGPRVAQQAAFLSLAEKAKKAGGIYCKGVIAESGEDAANLPDDMRSLQFEMWLALPAAKAVIKAGETRLTDGKQVYTFRPLPEPEGRRRKLVGPYPALGPMALMYDALHGYSDLASAVAFKPADAPSGTPAAYKDMKWFRLMPALPQGHYVLKDAKDVFLALDPMTGLPRVLIGQVAMHDKTITETVTYESIRPLDGNGVPMSLPPEAGGAKWMDSDAKAQIPAPRELIGQPAQSQPASAQPASQPAKE